MAGLLSADEIFKKVEDAAVAATGLAGKPQSLPPAVPSVHLGTPTLILGKP